jgi:hypothetical protein
MRILPSLFVAAAILTAGPISTARAQMSCGDHRAVCVSACTPSHVARYHFGSLRRCTANCEPRWQECLRSGIWVDLERRSTGGAELAPPF